MLAAGVRLGLDTFSLRAQNWSPFEQLDYCARLGLQVVHFSEIRFLGGLDADHLRRVRAHADALGLDVEIGMRSIAPSATIFDAAAGAAASQLSSMIDAARIMRSPIVRCIVGRYVDRGRPGGIETLIDESVAVLKSVRSRAIDAGIRIAVENHAGDLQSRELAALVERAGTDYVGVCIDSGNALWAMENPHAVLRTLAPYVLTSHMRDGVVWCTDTGAAVAWTRMGQGNVDIRRYLRTFVKLCPHSAVTLEYIILPEPRPLDFRVPSFWDGYANMRAGDLIDFLGIAANGPEGVAPQPREHSAADDLDAIESSLAWMRDCLSNELPG
jgi:sugar phosphate isomerase/epimerase